MWVDIKTLNVTKEAGGEWMSEGNLLGKKFKELYKVMCQDEWNPYMVGVLIAFFSVLILAWMRPWGSVVVNR